LTIGRITRSHHQVARPLQPLHEDAAAVHQGEDQGEGVAREGRVASAQAHAAVQGRKRHAQAPHAATQWVLRSEGGRARTALSITAVQRGGPQVGALVRAEGAASRLSATIAVDDLYG
jgi:hypothetical protein